MQLIMQPGVKIGLASAKHADTHTPYVTGPASAPVRFDKATIPIIGKITLFKFLAISGMERENFSDICVGYGKFC